MIRLLRLVVAILSFSLFAFADQSIPDANSDPFYRQLREVAIGSESVAVTNFVLKRDAGTFTFKQGTFAFVSAVNGKVTGAVFVGDGEFHLLPPIRSEQRSLSVLTRSNEPGMTEIFKTVVLRFTDETYTEIQKAGTPAQGAIGNAAEELRHSQDDARKKIQTNYDARILQDVLSNEPGGFFLAFIRGQKYSDNMIYCIDPHGGEFVMPEEIFLRTYEDSTSGIWASFHYSAEYASGAAKGTQQNSPFAITSQNLDTRIEKSGFLRGNALTTITSQTGDLRAIGLKLYPTLRVQKVTDAVGAELKFIQEDKDRDPDFWVILPKGLAAGEEFQIRTIYQGKDAVMNEGGGNYYPVARDDWYPNDRFGRYSMYEMTFAVPKKLQLIGTGDKVSDALEGDWRVSVWKSPVPLAVAGFNLGEFRKLEGSLGKSEYLIESYANTDIPDSIAALKREASEGRVDTLGTMQTTTMMKKPLAEAQLAVMLFNDYFGPIPYKRLAMSQQTACTYGQAWPSLVYLPICSFFDDNVRYQLGFGRDRGYWKTVAPHEVSHQWWGQTVGFNSYRDQWMSEGFAMFSSSLFVQFIQKNNSEFRQYWKDQLDTMTEKNPQGRRPIDVGPVTAGYRLSNSRSGSVGSRLIYPKGGFILHMIRMMMWDNQNGDARFRTFMQDFVKTYYNKPASTEDFKAVLENHMTPEMDLEGNHKMDWFFNQYVYGTDLPNYQFEYNFGKGENGVVNLEIKVTQSNVDDSFRMVLPVYLELADGRVVRLGSTPLQGNNTLSQNIPLRGLKEMPKKAYLSYHYDVLGTGY
jgi:Peptidase family M1 domain